MQRLFKAKRPALAAVLGILLTAVSAGFAGQDERWVVAPEVNALDDFNVMPNSTALAKLMTEAAEYAQRWRLPVDAADWWQRRDRLERVVLRGLGLDPLPERTPMNVRITGRHDMGDYTIENVIFDSRPGFPVTANLYRPKTASPGMRPAVLCPIGHSLDEGKAEKFYQARCIKLARLGFVVLIYDAIGHGERCVPGNSHHEAGFALLPSGQTVLGFMVWDSMRGIDFLQSLPDVDPDCIGVTGNSGGGLNTLFTTALDRRVKCGALAGYVYQSSNWIKYSGPNCTCCFVPGLYREMDWFEIAGLAAPRALLMMQGDEDYIFPISGARKAGRATEALYGLLGYRDRARFDEFHGWPHGYWQPFREAMYGWMLYHLMGQGDGSPLAEGDVRPLEPDDPRLLCDKDGSAMAAAQSAVELAGELAARKVNSLPVEASKSKTAAVRRLAAGLAAPPERESHYLMPMVFDSLETANGVLEKVYFLSEIGQYIPGLLWLPGSAEAPYRTVIAVDDRGKAAVAGSGLVEPLLERGCAVLSVDLRGRGETLGRIGAERDNNFNFATLSVMWGRPAAGARAFDLKRTVDFVAGR
ncbi:MAG: acetylxylan esterase, partial [Candidatus Glassbacteria bacterium]|nr:acetylxylan esterase [Candidatus Glassbacteria bacterium]